MLRSLAILLACGISAGTASHPAQTTSAAVPLQYTPLSVPCRAVDTRLTGGPISGGTSQSFNPAGGGCSIPLPAGGPISYAMNVTVLPHGSLGYLTVWPTGTAQPLVSTLNSPDGRVKANAAIATGGNGGEVSVYASNTTDLVLDVTGYFTADTAAYVYVPMTPCRVVDTRINDGTGFGAPFLSAGQQRTFPLIEGSCNLPSAALANGGAVSLNVTAVPRAGHPVNYVTIWGASPTEPQTPFVSTLNVPTGTVTANAAIIALNPATSGSVSAFASNDTDLVLDVTGYFAPATLAPAGLSLYTLSPCRILDTRQDNGAFQGELTVPIATANPCALPANAAAWVLNATVVPSPILNYLSLWPDATPQPLVSTLNASDGSITSNMAITGTTNGAFDAFAQSRTQLIVDVAGYFARGAAISTPTVAFIGDRQTYSWITQPGILDAHPTWFNASTNTAETSDSMLARFQHDVLDHQPKPDVVSIWTGYGDLIAYPDWNQFSCGGYTLQDSQGNPVPESTCSNWTQMAQMAHAAGAKVIVGNMIGYWAPTDADFGKIVYYDSLVSKGFGLGADYPQVDVLLDYTGIVASVNWSDDGGQTFNAAGAAAVEATMQTEVQTLTGSSQ